MDTHHGKASAHMPSREVGLVLLNGIIGGGDVGLATLRKAPK